MSEGPEWQPNGEQTVVPLCASRSGDVCPIRSYYYRPDISFMRGLNT